MGRDAQWIRDRRAMIPLVGCWLGRLGVSIGYRRQ